MDLAFRAAFFGGGVLVGLPLAAALPTLLGRFGFERANFQGRSIRTAGGILFLAASMGWLLAGPREELLVAAAAAGFGVLGLIDDRWGTPEFKGLRGHLRALRSGRVTTGLLKAVGGAILAAWVAFQARPGIEALPFALLIALNANLFNLLDLRPLRTLKTFWLFTLVGVWTGPLLLAALLGLSLPYARLEARRGVMLGDVGANSLGAAMGVAAALLLHPVAAAIWVGALLLFHAWAEKHSLSNWISGHPWAQALDQLGWQNENR